MDRPVLFCYDGSEDRRPLCRSASSSSCIPLMRSCWAVWTPIAVQLARGGSLLAAIPNEGQLDEVLIAPQHTAA
jgi:hypothetical protein